MDTHNAYTLMAQLLSIGLCFATAFGVIYTIAFYVDGSEDHSHLKDREQRARMRRYGWYTAAATVIFGITYITTFDLLMGV
jgi:hypothetical protein